LAEHLLKSDAVQAMLQGCCCAFALQAGGDGA